MKPLPHHYDVHLSGGPSGYAELSSASLPALRTAPPVDYDGPGDAWIPEHLLLASVQACFLFTLRAIARGSKLEFTRLERPRPTVPAGTPRERVLQIVEKSEKKCLVSASLATSLRLELEIREA